MKVTTRSQCATPPVSVTRVDRQMQRKTLESAPTVLQAVSPNGMRLPVVGSLPNSNTADTSGQSRGNQQDLRRDL